MDDIARLAPCSLRVKRQTNKIACKRKDNIALFGSIRSADVAACSVIVFPTKTTEASASVALVVWPPFDFLFLLPVQLSRLGACPS